MSSSELNELNNILNQLQTHNKMLENQLTQLAQSNASRQPGSLPPQPSPPRDTANAITLRSGLAYDGPTLVPDKEPETVKEKGVEKEKVSEDVQSKGKEKESEKKN